MNPSGDPAPDELLRKADALIRRNRSDLASDEAEDLPLLVESMEDLPELTDALAVPPTTKEQAGGHDPAIDLRRIVAEAIASAHAEWQASQAQTLREVTERLRAEADAAQVRAIDAVRAQARQDAAALRPALLAQARKEAAVEIFEQFKGLGDSLVSTLDQWMAKELPRLIAAEMPRLVERLRKEAGAQLRASMLTQFEERLAAARTAMTSRRHGP